MSEPAANATAIQRRDRRWKIFLTALITWLVFVLAVMWTLFTLRPGAAGYFLMSASLPLTLVAMSAGVTLKAHGDTVLVSGCVLAIAQYASYGWLAGRAWIHEQALKGLLRVVALHVALVALAAIYHVLFMR